MSRIYLISRFENPVGIGLGDTLRTEGHEVFNGGQHCDDDIFGFSLMFLDWADTGVLVLPVEKAGHIEFGYLRGQKKRVYVLLSDGSEADAIYISLVLPDRRWFASEVCYDVPQLIRALSVP